MVSLQPPLSPDRRKEIPEFENLSKKTEESQTEQIFKKRSKAEGIKSISGIKQHLETPLPLEWQRCLDVVRYFWSNMISKLVKVCSSQITTRTHNRTSKDPRKSPEPASPDDHMSLDLRLNLPCESLRKSYMEDNFTKHSLGSLALGSGDLFMESSTPKKKLGGLRSSPSWLAFEGDHQEMVATVCTKCHMLVMLCKSSPACPNCKFMHPPDHSPPTLFKRKCTTLLF